MVAVDGVLIVLSVIAAFYFRLRQQELLVSYLSLHSKLVYLALVCGIPTLYFTGWYKGLTRYAGSYSLYGLLPRSALMVLVLLFSIIISGESEPPRSFWILYWILFTTSAIAVRIILRDLLIKNLTSKEIVRNAAGSDRTLIYGAGASGVALLTGIRNDPRFRIMGFVDDDIALHGRTLQRLPIYSPDFLTKIIEQNGIVQVLLALPTISRVHKRQLVDRLTHLGVKVLSIPTYGQLASGQRQVSDIQPVRIEDLLGREQSIANLDLLKVSVEERSVLVTGAGGSIGSELCRQIAYLRPTSIILVERNEFSLYTIENELRRLVETASSSRPNIQAVLCDATNQTHLQAICNTYNVNTVFHAAAYKHVPMVEANLCAGVANNILATKAIIEAAKNSTVDRLTLISTDKAVRPTNAMGASKRVCELLIQSAANAASGSSKIFSMVRFGNVLGSSGSVIPLFHQQIANGGPVTVTHPDITRYFMTIPEAVALVLQATGMAKGGELYLLDMGEPVRISDLARQMIELSGLRVKDNQNPDGDISILYTGLRPGEKLYEELLISSKDFKTSHPLIRKAHEPCFNPKEFKQLLEQLEDALRSFNIEESSYMLRRLVPEYGVSSVASKSFRPL